MAGDGKPVPYGEERDIACRGLIFPSHRSKTLNAAETVKTVPYGGMPFYARISFATRRGRWVP